MSALGNVIVCNDHVALIHPDLDQTTEDIIADTLKVEVTHLILFKVSSVLLLSYLLYTYSLISSRIMYNVVFFVCVASGISTIYC